LHFLAILVKNDTAVGAMECFCTMAMFYDIIPRIKTTTHNTYVHKKFI